MGLQQLKVLGQQKEELFFMNVFNNKYNLLLFCSFGA